MKILVPIALLALALTGCAESEEEPEGVIPEHMEQGMKKAEDVEGMLNDADQQRREEMDSQ